MTFFYDLNKRLDGIRATTEVTPQQLNERSMSRAAKGIGKYTQPGMIELSRLGREGASEKKMDAARAKYNQYDTEVDEGAQSQHAMDLNPDFNKVGHTPGTMDRLARGVKKAADFVAPGDEELLDRLQKSSGARQPGKAKKDMDEAAKYRDAKYKDRLYTQQPPEADRDDSEDRYYNRVKPADYAGAKRGMGGSEYDDNDPLRRGDGIGRSGIKNSMVTRGPRAGLPSRDQITSLKNSIRKAAGQYPRPDLPEGSMPMVKGPDGKSIPAFAEDGHGKNDLKKTLAKKADPVNKIKFADKIVGAKKEVDEASTGNAFDLKSKFNKDFQNPQTELPASRVNRGTYGTEYDGDRDDARAIATKKRAAAAAGQGTRGRGRPKNNANADTGEVMRPDFSAFGDKVKLQPFSGKITRNRMATEAELDADEYDTEGRMAKGDIMTIVRHARALEKILSDNDNLPEWVQAKLAKIEGMMTAVDDYMQNIAAKQDMQPMTEKAVSKNQAVAARIARGVQKGTADAEPGSASAEMAKMPAKSLKKLAKTDTEDLPKSRKKKAVDETTTSGAVATAAPAAQSAKGMTYGKGIYDSTNREIEHMIAESMNINMSLRNSDNGEASKELTVTATDEDAEILASMLRMAGLGGNQHSMHEAYGDTDETVNHADYPTPTEGTDNAMMYAGGMNGPKSTGQATVPVLASQLTRQISMEGEASNMNDPSDGSMADQVFDLLSRLEQNMMEIGAYGDPDFRKILAALNQGDVESAVEEVTYNYTDQDGGEINSREFDAYIKDLENEFKDMVGSDDLDRMREMAGMKKKPVDEENTTEGNFFTGNLAKARAAGMKQADLDGDGKMEKVTEDSMAENLMKEFYNFKY